MTTEDIQTRFLMELSHHGISRIDLAICRGPERRFQLRGLQNLTIEEVRRRLPWLRHENQEGADIYFRPEKGGYWPIIFLDDLTSSQAQAMTAKYQCWIVETSQGRSHVWLLTDRSISPLERYTEQKIFVQQGIGDPGSVSGDHFGRLPGFRSWKRSEWVNLKSSPDFSLPLLHPQSGELHSSKSVPSNAKLKLERGEAVDGTASGKEFGWCCGWLRAGLDPEEAIRRLIIRAMERGKNSPEAYARRTVRAAQEKVR
jgi:hypothetical protein